MVCVVIAPKKKKKKKKERIGNAGPPFPVLGKCTSRLPAQGKLNTCNLGEGTGPARGIDCLWSFNKWMAKSGKVFLAPYSLQCSHYLTLLPLNWPLSTSASFPARVSFSAGISSHLRHHQAALCGPSPRPSCHQLPRAASPDLLGDHELRDTCQRDPCQQWVRGRAAHASVKKATPE